MVIKTNRKIERHPKPVSKNSLGIGNSRIISNMDMILLPTSNDVCAYAPQDSLSAWLCRGKEDIGSLPPFHHIQPARVSSSLTSNGTSFHNVCKQIVTRYCILIECFRTRPWFYVLCHCLVSLPWGFAIKKWASGCSQVLLFVRVPDTLEKNIS